MRGVKVKEFVAKEFEVVALRECPLPADLHECDTPVKAFDYWNTQIASHPYFNPECECFAVMLLNTRRKVKGHSLISIGTMDTILVSPREVFRTAIIASASALVLMHNHPSGEGDIAIGNVVGSNIFNLLFIGGTVSIIKPIPVPSGGITDLIVLSVLSVLVLPICIRKERTVTRGEGAFLLCLYFSYLFWRIFTNP